MAGVVAVDEQSVPAAGRDERDVYLHRRVRRIVVENGRVVDVERRSVQAERVALPGSVEVGVAVNLEAHRSRRVARSTGRGVGENGVRVGFHQEGPAAGVGEPEAQGHFVDGNRHLRRPHVQHAVAIDHLRTKPRKRIGDGLSGEEREEAEKALERARNRTRVAMGQVGTQ